MTTANKEEHSLRKLIRLARNNADEANAHMANLDAARASAETSLEWLAQAVQVEKNAVSQDSAANLVDLARYLEGAAEKRAALEATRQTLSTEIEVARASLGEIFGELKKLEHLLEISRRAAKKRHAKMDAVVLDAAARNRAGG